MIISGLIGFVFFAVVPMAPPRFAASGDRGHGDGVLERLPGPAASGDHEPAGRAARASQSACRNLLPRHRPLPGDDANSRPGVRGYPCRSAMAFAVVATANHYVLDVVLGAVVVLVGLADGYPSPRAYTRWR